MEDFSPPGPALQPTEEPVSKPKVATDQDTGDLDLDWSDIKRFAKSSRIQKSSKAGKTLDTIDGQARVLKGIIENKEERTENVLAAIKQLRELRGTDRIKTENLALMTNRELVEIFNEDIFPILALFRVKD